MMRACFTPVSQAVRGSLRQKVAVAPVARMFQPMAALSSTRFFAAGKPKVEDLSLQGRYATALFMATNDRMDKVYQDLMNLRSMMAESADMKLMVETPGIDPKSKVVAIESICKAGDIDAAVVNFMKVLVENRRLPLLSRMIDLYETFYRAEKGLVQCIVTSAGELSKKEKTAVEKAMQARAGADKTLIMDYNTNAAILGGLVVKMGESVIDQSVSSRLARMETQLLAPLA